MKSRTTRRFRERLAKLPAKARKQARAAYKLFRDDPSHPGLHFKLVLTEPPTYSARVGIGYRAVGVLEGDTVIWFWIGTHAEYDKLLKMT
jgi:mRNA-degrading endonuclease RelE of RelBE toxin-antitoxin system